MKINIVTFFWSKNLGALIQAFSLKNFIEREFNTEVKFNNYSPNNLIVRERMSQFNSKNLKIIHQVILKKIKLFNWKKKVLKCENPSQKIQEYKDDLYIYGSDEIWNYQNPFFGFDPFFFGKNNIKKKISYATSIGSVNYLKDQKIELVKDYLKNFENISVRDSVTQSFVESCIGNKPEIVLDPCFLINLEEILQKKNNYDFNKKKYILIYGDYFNDEQVKSIKKISKKNNWIIISLSFYNSWADRNIISVDPLDLINFIINSNLVITSMFHGVMLSYKYKSSSGFLKIHIG